MPICHDNGGVGLSAWRASLDRRQRAGGCAVSVFLGFVCFCVWFGHVFGDYIGPQPMPVDMRLERDVALALGQSCAVLCTLGGLWLTDRGNPEPPQGCASILASTIRGVVAILFGLYLPLLGVIGIVTAYKSWTDGGLPTVLSKAVSSSANTFLAMVSILGLLYLARPLFDRSRRRRRE